MQPNELLPAHRSHEIRQLRNDHVERREKQKGAETKQPEVQGVGFHSLS